MLWPGTSPAGGNSSADCVDTPADEAHDTAVTASTDSNRSERARTPRT
jgi:hypothetical protein